MFRICFASLAVIAIAASFTLYLAGTLLAGPVGSGVRPAITITEDDPRWDCSTMGNLICGKGK